MITVAHTRSVNGIEECFFAAAKELIAPEDLRRAESLEQFADHVQLYGNGVAQALVRYILSRSELRVQDIAVRGHVFYATEQEFIQAREAIYRLLQSLEAQPPAPGRKKYRLFVMGHPSGAATTEA